MIVHGLTAGIPDDIFQEIFAFRYREYFKLSAVEFENEPWEALYQARLMWSFDDERVKLENIRQQPIN
ncbi:hypothetical protein AR689_07650 [Arthrobacter sp. EpRS71]|nr:hypothetical protein AR689_07650 [Arthrobacter sp. EpRS71]